MCIPEEIFITKKLSFIVRLLYIFALEMYWD